MIAARGNRLLDRLRYHVSGVIERGEAVAIVEIPSLPACANCGEQGALLSAVEQEAMPAGSVGEAVCGACYLANVAHGYESSVLGVSACAASETALRAAGFERVGARWSR